MAVVVTVAAVVAGCGSVSKTADEYVQDAQQQRLSGNLNAAVLDLKSALQKSPDNGAARYMLGEIYIDIGDGASAEKELTRAKDLKVDPDSLVLPLARAWLLQREFQKVLDEVPVPEGKDNRKVAVLNLHGQAFIGLGDLDKAEAAFKQAQMLAPDSVDAVIGLARVAMGQGKLDDAQALQNQAEKLSPHGIESLRLKADLAFLKKDYKAASEDYAALVKQRPQSLTFHLAQAWAQVGAGELDEAAKNLDNILRSTPNVIPANYLRGVVYFDQKKFDDATNAMDKVLSQSSNYAPALLLAGAASYQLKHYEQARNHLSRLVGLAPKFEPGLKLMAMTQMQLGQNEAAAATLKPLMVAPDKIKDDQTLRLVAAAALRSGDLESGKNYIEKAVERAPDDTALRTQLGLTRISLGETDQGLEDLAAAAKEAPKVGGAEVTLGYNQLKAGKLDDALKTAKNLQESMPKESIGYVLEGMVHDRQGDQDAAKASFTKALGINPAAVDAVHNMALIETRNNRLKEAEAIYDSFLKANPDNIPILAEAARLENKMGDVDKAEQRLGHIVELKPDLAPARVYLGQLYLKQGNAAKAASLQEEVLQDNQDNPGLLEVLGRAQLDLGQADQAVTTFTQLSKIKDKAPMAHYWLARARFLAGDLTGAKTSVDRSLSLQADNLNTQLLKGDIAAKAGDKAALQAVMQTLSKNKAVMSSEAYKGLEASMASLNGNWDKAIRIDEELNKTSPTSARTSELALFEVRKGDTAAAVQRLGAWVKEHPDDTTMQIQLAGLYSNQGDYDSAEGVLTGVVEKDPKLWAGQNDLAWALYKQDKIKDALKHADAAAKLAPNNPLVLDTYGTVLLASGDARKAIVYLERVVQAAPGLTSSQVTLAKSYIEANRPDDARQLLQRLLRDNSTFPEKDQAQSLLDQLQKPKQE